MSRYILKLKLFFNLLILVFILVFLNKKCNLTNFKIKKQKMFIHIYTHTWNVLFFCYQQYYFSNQ